IVAMHHLVTSPIAEQGLDVLGFSPDDAGRLGAIIGDEAAGKFLARAVDDAHRVTPCEAAVEGHHARREQALPAAQSLLGTAVDGEPTDRHEGAGNPSLASL